MQIRVLLVDDDSNYLSLIKDFLVRRGHQAYSLCESNRVETIIQEFQPNIIVLDQAMFPKRGIDVLAELRANPPSKGIPVMMLTGDVTEDTKLKSFAAGADDYLVKPFSLKEFEARLQAMLRRSGTTMRGLVMNLETHCVRIDGAEVPLTLTEFHLLQDLLAHLDSVRTREQIRSQSLSDHFISDRTIDVHMASLRKKLGEYGRRIKTVRGVGFRLSTQD